MTEPEELPADDHPAAAAEGDLHSVTDDEYFTALHVPELTDAETGQPVDSTEGVVDAR